MKQLYLIIFLNFSFLLSVQSVGINTTEPKASLSISPSAGNNIPVLQLQPQNNPIGNADGELAIIGDKLYLYNSMRSKWLTAETSMYSFAEDGNAATRLEYTADVEQTGPIIPINATIVEINIRARNATVNKRIQLHINGIAVPNNDFFPNSDGALALDNNNEYYNGNYNLDINRGDILTVTQTGGGVLQDVIVDVILKWRN